MFGYRLLHVLLHPWVIAEEIASQIKWACQRVFRGWDDRVAYGIDWYLTANMPAWIKRMQQYGNSYPFDTTPEEWHGILDEIADGFRAGYMILDNKFPAWQELWDSGWTGGDIPNPDGFWVKVEEQRDEAIKRYNHGMELFVKYFFNLWD